MIQVLNFSPNDENPTLELTVRIGEKMYAVTGQGSERGGEIMAVDNALEYLSIQLGVEFYSLGIWIDRKRGQEAVSTAKLAYNPNGTPAGSPDHKIYEYEARHKDPLRAYLNAQLGALEMILDNR